MVLVPLPGPALSLLAALPILLLLGGMAVLGWSPPRTAGLSFGLALLLAVTLYGLTPAGTAVAMAKAGLLSLFILLIVWAALFLHTLLERLGAIGAIGESIGRSARWAPARVLLIAWGFSGFVQGFAGAGAPVASAAPLLRDLGFGPVPAAAAAMIGHSWAITFGSMGSSYFAIALVTRLPPEELAPWLGRLFVAPVLLTGLAVLHLLLGWQGVREAGVAVLGVGLLMAGALWGTAVLGAGPVASILAAMVGCVALLAVGAAAGGNAPRPSRRGSSLPLRLALLPYLLLVVITLATQTGPGGGLARAVSIGMDLPATVTVLGHQAPAELNYPRLRVLQHPATIIAVAIAATSLVYHRLGRWPRGALGAALGLTYRRVGALTLVVLFMVLMALVMADAGMVEALAAGLRSLAGPAFPVLSPFLGVLGAVMTGSNTSSNITMGVLQVQTAAGLGLTPALIAAAQSVGGSLGAGVSADKATIGAAATGAEGQEAAIIRRALPYALLITASVGAQTLALALVS